MSRRPSFMMRTPPATPAKTPADISVKTHAKNPQMSAAPAETAMFLPPQTATSLRALQLASDTVDEGDDDEEDDENPFWGNEAPDVAIRAPSTTDACSVTYTNFKHRLDDFLSSRYESYFFAPAIVTPRHRSDIAALVILLDDQDDSEELPSPDDLSRIVGIEFVFVIGKGLFEGSVSSEQSLGTRVYHHLNIMAGDSIEVKDQEIGTAGIFVKSKDKVIGITAGRVMDGTEVGSAVIQPALSDFKRCIRDIERKVKASRTAVLIVGPHELDERREELEEWEKILTELVRLKGQTDSDTKANLIVGNTIKWELTSVEYNGRRCYCDYGTFELVPGRTPKTNIFSGAPESSTSFLDGFEWDGVQDWGEVQFDEYVRKTGRKTGLTFGVVAGVHCGFVNPAVPSPPTDEFYVLQEANEEFNQFAMKGDGGSAVITNDGKLVGFVHCAIKITDVQIVCLPGTLTPDLRTISERRDSDGEIDLDRLWHTNLRGRKFVLVESAIMVKERANLNDAIFPNS